MDLSASDDPHKFCQCCHANLDSLHLHPFCRVLSFRCRKNAMLPMKIELTPYGDSAKHPRDIVFNIFNNRVSPKKGCSIIVILRNCNLKVERSFHSNVLLSTSVLICHMCLHTYFKSLNLFLIPECILHSCARKRHNLKNLNLVAKLRA